MKRTPILTEELITWMEDDWLGLWELTAIGGIDEGVPLVDVIEFVIQSVEPGLRDGAIRLGRVYATGTFEPIDAPTDRQLAMIREGVWQDRGETVVDLWFDQAASDVGGGGS